jgi:glycosyltransferase involved in cell wall biosynthesis
VGENPVTCRYGGERTEAVGIVLPVHNEDELLPRALTALGRAFGCVPRHVECRVALVLDSCRDASRRIAHQWSKDRSCLVLHRRYGNVGAARRDGCAAIMDASVRRSFDGLWLATTDADSEVPDQWLNLQIDAHERGSDLFAGRVEVVDWSPHHDETERRWLKEYGAETVPIHGANFGINAAAYCSLGGFRALRTGEDRDLYDRAVAAGLFICHDGAAKVTTSARRQARAPLGFSHALCTIEYELEGS